MIGRLSGILRAKEPPQVLIEVQGVGYEVDVPMSTYCELPQLGESLALWTHLVVREDAHLLFGFLSEEERATFRQLLKINGVGPRLALGVLSTLSAMELAQAVARQDDRALTSIPGVGKKTAQRLLLELKDKLPQRGAVESGAEPAVPDVSDDLIRALASLGYQEKEAQRVIRQIDPGLSLEDAIRRSLGLLARRELG